MTLSSDARLKVVIPARHGSSRLPGKPLIDLAGKPMAVRVYEAVHRALGEQAEIVVAVDDQRVLDVLVAHDICGMLTDTKHESGTDRVAEVARERRWTDHDIVVNVQGDEPLVPVDLLSAFATFCAGQHDLLMATVSAPIDTEIHIHDPNVVKLSVDVQGRAIVFSRAAVPYDRDAAPQDWQKENYLRHVGIYAYRNSTLQQLTRTPSCAIEQIEKLEQLRALWVGIPIHVMPWHQSPPHGVDTKADADRVSAIFKENANECDGY